MMDLKYFKDEEIDQLLTSTNALNHLTILEWFLLILWGERTINARTFYLYLENGASVKYAFKKANEIKLIYDSYVLNRLFGLFFIFILVFSILITTILYFLNLL